MSKQNQHTEVTIDKQEWKKYKVDLRKVMPCVEGHTTTHYALVDDDEVEYVELHCKRRVLLSDIIQIPDGEVIQDQTVGPYVSELKPILEINTIREFK